MASRKQGVKAPSNSETEDPHAGPEPERQKCADKTTKGKPCPRWALPGMRLCARHLNAGRGRPTKLSDEITQTICEHLREGGYAETAAAAAGVSKSTFYEWMARGDAAGAKKVDEPYRIFRARIEEARAMGETVRVQQIADAAKNDWRAAAWMLEREHPDRWGGPRARNVSTSVHPGDFADGERSSGSDVVDDQVGPDGRPL